MTLYIDWRGSYKKGNDEILRSCINPSEVPVVLEGCHSEVCGGHFVGLVTAQKHYNEDTSGLLCLLMLQHL